MVNRQFWELYLVSFAEGSEKPVFLLDPNVRNETEYLLYFSIFVEDIVFKPRIPFPLFTFCTRIVMEFLPENAVFEVLAMAMVFGENFHSQTSAVEIIQFHASEKFLPVGKNSR